MDDQLVIDASGAWVRKAAQLIAEKPLLSPELSGGMPNSAGHSFSSTGNQREDTYTVLLD